MHGGMTRARAMVGLLMLVLALGVRLPDAAAHVVLIDSCPGVDERISDLPTVRFTFDGPLIVDDQTPAFMELRDSDGAEAVPLGPVQLVGVNALVAQVLGPVAPGDYTAVYDVVSADGDPNVGEVDFAFDGLDDEATNCLDPDFDDGCCDQSPSSATATSAGTAMYRYSSLKLLHLGTAHVSLTSLSWLA